MSAIPVYGGIAEWSTSIGEQLRYVLPELRYDTTFEINEH